MYHLDLYNLLHKEPEYLDSSIVLSDFFISMAGSAIQGLAALEVGMDDLISTQQSLYLMIQSNAFEIYNKSLLLEDFNERIKNGDFKEASKDSANAVRTNIIQNIEYLINYNQNAMATLLNTLKTSAEDLLAENQSISTNGTYTTNNMSINDIHLEFLGVDNQDEFLNSKAEQILEVADQCPLTGGPAVYRARSLYARIVPDHTYEDELTCLQSGYTDRTNFQKSGNSFAYPNPAKNEITIRYTYENAKMIEVNNAIGTVISSIPSEANTSEIKINTENWKCGIYIYRILDFEGNLIDVNRFIILK